MNLATGVLILGFLIELVAGAIIVGAARASGGSTGARLGAIVAGTAVMLAGFFVMLFPPARSGHEPLLPFAVLGGLGLGAIIGWVSQRRPGTHP